MSIFEVIDLILSVCHCMWLDLSWRRISACSGLFTCLQRASTPILDDMTPRKSNTILGWLWWSSACRYSSVALYKIWGSGA
ncbi:Endolysin [Fusarium oxysporum f. sp. albedinis]|nr:Endolysin [Fusarium oxysporum f. sp. albedinis]